MSEATRAPGARPGKGRVGTLVNGKWQIDARIGSGGMATVYAATHRNGHRVALKMLHPTLSCDAATRARFLREGYVANAVGHSGVVRVEDDGVTEDGAAFLVLDLLEGDTMEARRERCGGIIEIEEVIEIADQMLDVLAAAHDKGIVHRDVKPENVFLTKQGDVKLLDFGLALMKSTQVAENTKTGMTIGTPAFMAPEQAQGLRDEVDARSDVWSLGATVYTAITGKYVHEAETLREQLVANALKPATPIRELAPHVPVSVAVVIDRALELEKKDRWASAREMQRAFRAARAARPDSDRMDADSLTMPAVSPVSIRQGLAAAAAAAAVRSSPRPNSGPLSRPVPSSDATMDMKVPSSDVTLDEQVPVTILDPQVVLEGLPSSGAPFSKPPSTERIKGSPQHAAQAAASQAAQSAAKPLSSVPEPPPAQRAPQARYDSTLSSNGATTSVLPPMNAGSSTSVLPPARPIPTGSGAHASIPSGSGAHPSLPTGSGAHASIPSGSGAHASIPSGSGPYAPIPTGSGPYPSIGSGPYPATGSGPYPSLDGMQRGSVGSVPPPGAHPSMHPRVSGLPLGAPPLQAGASGPVSIPNRKSGRTVVVISILLILICAAVGAYVTYRPALPFHF